MAMSVFNTWGVEDDFVPLIILTEGYQGEEGKITNSFNWKVNIMMGAL